MYLRSMGHGINMVTLLWLLQTLVCVVDCDYPCVCTYTVETPVFSSYDKEGGPVGYMYEFDCNPVINAPERNGLYGIMFNNTVAYLEKTSDVEKQMCQGNIPANDIVTTTEHNPATTSVTSLPRFTSTNVESTVSEKSLDTADFSSTPSATPPTQTVSTTPTTLQPNIPMTFSSNTALPTTSALQRFPMANVTGTPYQYIGVGYDLPKGNPEQSPDPGLLLNKHILQLTSDGYDIKEASITESPCTTKPEYTLVHDAVSLQNEMFLSVQGLQYDRLAHAAFQQNQDFKNYSAAIEANNQVVHMRIATCSVYNVSYETELSKQEHYTVSLEFAIDVCNLYTQESEDDFKTLFDKWGTNVVVAATLGTRETTRNSMTINELVNHIMYTDIDVLYQSGEYAGFSSSLVINTTKFLNNDMLRNTFMSGHTTTIGTIAKPELIKIVIAPILDFIESSYFDPLREILEAEGMCRQMFAENGLEEVKQRMADALQNYQTSGSVSTLAPHKEHLLQVPVTWPRGTYTLMNTAQGCPEDQVTWHTGWRSQDTEDINTNNYFSNGISSYLAGNFGSNVRTEFCSKTALQISPYDRNWPRGNYCILQQGTCPTGFAEGYIYWDDEDFGNTNDYGGTLPEGTYNSNTKIYYCCRADGSHREQVILPTSHPFILMRQGGACQSVYGMNVADVYVRWDDDDMLNTSRNWGSCPDDDGGDNNHLLHFCYYYA